MNREKLKEALKSVGLQAGDTVLVHSDLRPFGIPEGAKTSPEILRFYLDGFMEQIGTLVVPAYFYEYARFGEPFDVDRSPVSKPLGVFSAYVAGLPERIRSCNPLQSIAAIGGQAEELCGGDSLMGYGTSSPWHRLRKMGGKMLFLGVTLQPMTFVHHIEQQFGVPHLYHKVYNTPVTKNGKRIEGMPISAVRFLEYQIEYDLKSFQQELAKRGQLREASIGDAPLFAVEAEDAYQTGLQLLEKNPYTFLKHPPAFIPGKIPTDGVTHARS